MVRDSLAGGPNDLWDNDPTKPLQSDPDVEVALHLEIVSSIATGAKSWCTSRRTVSQSSLDDAVMTAVHDDATTVRISTSSGGAEEIGRTAELKRSRQCFRMPR